MFTCSIDLGEDKSPFWFRNRTTGLFCRFDPFLNNDFGIRQRRLISRTVSHTTRQFRNFCDISIVVFAPINDYFVFTHRLLLIDTSRLCYEPVSPDKVWLYFVSAEYLIFLQPQVGQKYDDFLLSGL